MSATKPQETIWLVFVRATPDDDIQVIGAYRKEEDAKTFMVNNLSNFTDIFYNPIGIYG